MKYFYLQSILIPQSILVPGLLCLCLPIALSACSRLQVPGEGAGAAEETFYEVAEQYLDAYLRIHPTEASYLGYHKYSNLYEDFSPDGITAARTELHDFRNRLQEIDPEALGLSARIDYDLISNSIDYSLFQIDEYGSYAWDPIKYNDIIGFSALALVILDDDSPKWPDRLGFLLERLKRLPAFLEMAKANLSDVPTAHARYVAGQHAGNIDFYEKQLPTAFAKAPALQAELEAANQAAVEALKNYHTFLKDDLLPRATKDWRIGGDLWTKKLSYVLHSDMTPQEILDRARAKYEADRAEVVELARRIHAERYPDHRHSETGEDLTQIIVREVIDLASEHHSIKETILEDARKWVAKVKAFIAEEEIVTLPPETDNFVIEYSPKFLEGLAVAYFNPAPVFEPELKKSYWISHLPSTGDPEKDAAWARSYFREYNDHGLQSLTMHEAFPGHYVQQWHEGKSAFTTKYKKVFASGTFVEGWAVLSEEMMFERGYDQNNDIDEPLTLFMHKKINLRTSLNAIIDQRMHTLSEPDEKTDKWVLDLLMKGGFQEEAEAKGKLRRAKISSTQLSTYFVGYAELSDIYEDYKKLKGKAFRLREFNDLLLSYGSPPPRALRALILGDTAVE